MESIKENVDSTKTPRRTRKSSVAESKFASPSKRSAKKEVTENEETAASSSDPRTPSRSTTVLEFRTPSRSDAVAAAQTPRRSARKSIKPLQEYENIVAQKGLVTKRIASSSVEEEEQAADGKWLPAVIGRASTKRGKKSGRSKNKRLKRQKNFTQEEAEDVEESCNNVPAAPEQNNDDKETELDDETFKTNNEATKSHVDGLLENDIEQESEVLEKAEQCNGNGDDVKKIKHPIEGEKPYDGTSSEDPIKLDSNQEETEIEQANDRPPIEDHKNESSEITDSSMEGGDVEMATMPITADDMESPEKIVQFSSVKVTTTSVAPVSNISDDSDCIMLSLNESSRTEQSDSQDPADNNMPSLLVCSDDEEEVDCSEGPAVQDHSKETQSETDAITVLNDTFDADDTESPSKETGVSMLPQTPVLRPSIARIPTPFKLARSSVPDIVIESEEEVNSVEKLPEVIVQPSEVRLKSSRKRSFSVSTDRPKKIVTFHSPANTTVCIYDGNLIKSSIKEGSNYVAPPRKRSLSVTETNRDLAAYIKQNKSVADTPENRKKLPQPTSRTKMPNFAAIHQQQFKRMESISDHVARKAERAKILTNSATKAKPASIQKGLPVKNSVLRDFNKDSAENRTLPVPKARHRIELSGVDHKPKTEISNTSHLGLKIRSKSKTDLSTLDDLRSMDKMSKSFVFTSNSKLNKLPRPRFDVSANTLKAPLTSTTTSKPTSNVFKPTTSVPDPRPRFNLSTATDSQQNKSTSKLDDRRKRLMDMYKSRSQPRTGDKKREILKGVRTNRRFELQMMCRNRPSCD